MFLGVKVVVMGFYRLENNCEAIKGVLWVILSTVDTLQPLRSRVETKTTPLFSFTLSRFSGIRCVSLSENQCYDFDVANFHWCPSFVSTILDLTEAVFYFHVEICRVNLCCPIVRARSHSLIHV